MALMDSGDPFILNLLKAIGAPPNVTKLSLHAEVNRAVEVTLTFYPEIKPGVRDELVQQVERYRLQSLNPDGTGA